VRAIVRVLVSLVVAWLSVLSPSVGWATPSATPAAYAYDSQHRPALVVTDSFERGPPVPASIGSTDDAVHGPSRGASARLNTSTTPTDSTYVHPVRLVPVASVTPTAERPAETARAAISSRNRPEVAAKSGSKFAKLAHAADGIAPYNIQRPVTAGHGGEIQAHHLIEKRFAAVMGENTADMPSIVVTRAEHQVFTNEWRRAFPTEVGT